MKFKAKIIFEWEYDIDPKNYGTSDPNKMIQIDISNAKEDIEMFLISCDKMPLIEIQQIS